MNEHDLVLLCKKGNRDAMKQLYEQYAPLMMGISMRYTGSQEHSKDILHDSFVKIFGSIDRFDYKGVGSLKAWITRIVVNTSLTGLRKGNTLLLTDENDFKNIPDEDDEAQLSLYKSVSNKVIVEHIGRLPARLRVIFNMYMIEDMPHSEIAEQLNITEQASRTRLHRAKQILADELRKYLKNEQ